MRISVLLAVCFIFGTASFAAAQEPSDCKFRFDIETQSSAFQSMVVDGEQKRGFWLSINRAPADVRSFARHIGRLQVCLMTPDGKPRLIQRGSRTIELKSPFVAHCTAALLPNNQLLTNAHCFYDPDLVSAGFSIVHKARIEFNYTSKDDTGAVQFYPVSTNELDVDNDLDAMVLQVLGRDANADLGGHIPLKMISEVEPFQALGMIHHPGGDPQQYSSGTCQVHRRQTEIPDARSPFRHTCESMGGSSGSLLFDSRTLSVVALHNQGGLNPTGDSFNSGHKIGKIEASLNLGFEEYARQEATIDAAQRALTDALLQFDTELRAQALNKLIKDFPGTSEAEKANLALAQMPDSKIDATQTLAKRALDDALLHVELNARITALRKVVIDFAGTEPAEKAQSVIADLEARSTHVSDSEEPSSVSTNQSEDTSYDPEVLTMIEACKDALASKETMTERGFVSSSRGYMYVGEGALPWNQPAPMDCVRSAIKAPEHPRAARLYGLAVWNHEGTRGNEGRYWLRLAAANGDAMAKGQLGWMLLHGYGGRKDETRGLKLLEEASDAGDGLASTILGNKSYKTDGKTARRYFERGSFQGATGSDFFLAMHYLDADSDYSLDEKEYDIVLAEQYLERAQAGGNGLAYLENALINLGHDGAELSLIKSGQTFLSATDKERAIAGQQAARNAARNVYSVIDNTGTLEFILALSPETLRVADWRDYYWIDTGLASPVPRVYECQTIVDSIFKTVDCPPNEFDRDREKLKFFWNELQTLLRDDGFYKGKIDGDFGPGSRAALQRSHEAKQKPPRAGIEPTDLAYEDSPIVSECLRLSSGIISDEENAYRACSISSDRFADQPRVAMGMGDALATLALNTERDTEHRAWALRSARQAYQKALRLNHPRAAVELALLPESPDANPRSVAELKSSERAWLRQSANDGNSRAKLLLAEAFDTGEGFPRDALIAAQFIVSALEISEPKAIELLSRVSVETRLEVQKIMTKQSVYSGPLDGEFDTDFLTVAHDFCGC